jgi:hypothetical protein
MMNDSFFLVNRKLFADNEIVYVSCPITTGERFIQWYASKGKGLDKNSLEYIKEKDIAVISQNVRSAKNFIQHLRKTTNKVIIDPTNLEDDSLKWSQNDYYQFWDKVIQDLVSEVIFLDGWEYSVGCCVEYLSATKKNIKQYSQNGEVITLNEAIKKINYSTKMYEINEIDVNKLTIILDELKNYEVICNDTLIEDKKYLEMKDDKLNYLISKGSFNIAQFVSVEPREELKPKYVHINNFRYESSIDLKSVIEKLILTAPSKAVNIRSFSPQVMKGNRLIYNKTINNIDEILEIINENSLAGKHSIINENIDIKDGGVSGVVLKDIIEFAPEDTPKCVDKNDVCSLPKSIGFKLLKNVYGFSPTIEFDSNYRVEFSIHPKRQGVLKEHTIIWEYENYQNAIIDNRVQWPNRFSKFIGDKVFGLLIADAMGLLVPKSTVISRKVSPFSFGTETGLKEKWIRTCPIKKEPGKYYTGHTWIDPFKLMENEELKGERSVNLASIISQDAVESLFSGASFIRENEEYDLIEGVTGKGDQFMVGEKNTEKLPEEVIRAVQDLNNKIRLQHKILGDISIEWVYDGENVWIVQMNQLRIKSEAEYNQKQVIVSGNPTHYEKVYVNDGLDNLRNKIKQLDKRNVGIELIGNIGITSHFGDLLRLAGIPSILLREE